MTAYAGRPSLADTDPDLSSQADGWDPATVTPRSGRKVAWRCPACEHRWQATVGSRARLGAGCPRCAARRARQRTALPAPGNSVLEVCPAVAAEADGWDPATVARGSSTKMPWRCRSGHTWDATPNNRIAAGTGCPRCATMPLPGQSLTDIDPDLAAQAHGWDASTVGPGDSRPRSWQGACGHTWSATIANRRKGSTCGVCAGKVVQAGVNDLATLFPDVAADADGWDPTQVTARSSRVRRPWRCRVCGHRWVTAVGDRTRRGTGCPPCARKGFNPAAPGVLYLLALPDATLVKYGITNDAPTRLADHAATGFTVVLDLLASDDGHTVAAAEYALKAALRRDGVSSAKATGAHRFDGYTEAFTPPPSLRHVRSLEQLASALGVDMTGLRPDPWRPAPRPTAPGPALGANDPDAAWSAWAALLATYADQHGHARPPVAATHDGRRLGRWVAQQRGEHAAGRLPEPRRQALEALPGWVWNANAAAWEDGFARLSAYVAHHGHARVPGAFHCSDGYALGAWTMTQRRQHAAGALTPARAGRLSDLPSWAWQGRDARWWANLAALADVVAATPTGRVPPGTVGPDGTDLTSWARAQRRDLDAGLLAADRAAALGNLGLWSTR